MLSRKYMLPVLLFFCMILLWSAFHINLSPRTRMRKVIHETFTTETIYEKPASFAYDPFEVHQFSLSQQKPLEGFKIMDATYKQNRNTFQSLLTSSLENEKSQRQSLQKILDDLHYIEKSIDSTYFYRESKEMQYELYVYSENQNLGYYFFLKL